MYVIMHNGEVINDVGYREIMNNELDALRRLSYCYCWISSSTGTLFIHFIDKTYNEFLKKF